jgi:hypothetical protein
VLLYWFVVFPAAFAVVVVTVGALVLTRPPGSHSEAATGTTWAFLTSVLPARTLDSPPVQ